MFESIFSNSWMMLAVALGTVLYLFLGLLYAMLNLHIWIRAMEDRAAGQLPKFGLIKFLLFPFHVVENRLGENYLSGDKDGLDGALRAYKGSKEHAPINSPIFYWIGTMMVFWLPIQVLTMLPVAAVVMMFLLGGLGSMFFWLVQRRIGLPTPVDLPKA